MVSLAMTSMNVILALTIVEIIPIATTLLVVGNALVKLATLVMV